MQRRYNTPTRDHFENPPAWDGNLSKETLNYELIRDFVIMLNARHTIVDDMSLVSQMAASGPPRACRGAALHTSHTSRSLDSQGRTPLAKK